MTSAGEPSPTPTTEARRSSLGLAVWSVVAAFGAYFCVYAFRKPFTAASYSGGTVFGLGEKTVLVTSQVIGYMVAKIVGVKVIAEMPPQRRAGAILLMVALALGSLLLFAVAPSPWHVLCLFLNGLPMGMVFGLVLGYLEGRRHTEALAAGLCASFIVADGVTKSVGTWLLDMGVTERWMPAAAALIFLTPMLGFVAMLARIPPPDARDVAHRSERAPMHAAERLAFLKRHGVGLAGLVGSFLLVTIVRSMRADFAPEIWKGLGFDAAPSTFSRSESLVALGVLVVNGLSILILDNRRAFFVSIGVSLAGLTLMALALLGLRMEVLGAFPFMVAVGLGMYLPYVAMHTTIFERLIAMTRDRGNIGFLLYMADSVGYLGYIAVMLGKGLLPRTTNFVTFFATLCAIVAAMAAVCLVATWLHFAARHRSEPEVVMASANLDADRA